MSTNIESIVMWLDQSCGMLRVTEKKELAGIDLFPETARTIDSFKTFGVKTILFLPKLISASVETIMEFIPQFDEVVICEDEKNIQKHLEQYNKNADSTLFVSSDRVLRGVAANMGLVSIPHPQIALHILQKTPYHMVQIFGLKEQVSSIHEGIPYFFYEVENDKWCLLSVIADDTIQELITHGMKVQKFPINLSTEDPIFLEMDEWDEETAEDLKKHKVLSIEGRKMIVALDPTEFNEEVHIHGLKAHVDPQLLLPSPELFYPVENYDTFNDLTNADPSEFKRSSNTGTEPFLFENISASTAESFQAIVDRYSGKSDLDTQGPVASRHISHPDNVRVIQALQNDLAFLGYCPILHRFSLSGMSLNNVIADLPGTGSSSSFGANVQEQLRELFLKYPNPAPVNKWYPAVKEIIGEDWFRSHFTMDMNPVTLRKSIEESFGLRPWFPWWLESCALPGPGAQLIIVGCHLDSTAGFDSPYNPISDPAPGADDDGSGIAAVLSIAKSLSEFRGRLTHTVRFCFFNAEEAQLAGSKVYASMLKATGAPVKAVICMDMIGFNSDRNYLFEIHVGYSNPAIRDKSVPIAQTIANHAAGVTNLSIPQIYQGTTNEEIDYNRDVFDGAINRSDHASFHQQGYPAVVVSEDFFNNLPSEPPYDRNPNYHRGSDTSIDASYGSDITNVIVNAVLELATT